MQTVKIAGLLLLAALLTIIALVILRISPRLPASPQISSVTTFEECVQAGNPIMESYPRQCRSKVGAIFVEEIPQQNPSESGNLISNGCAIAGCSGQICVRSDIADSLVTTCEFRAEYACYREASCEPQADGICGWTETSELRQCLANPDAVEIELEVM